MVCSMTRGPAKPMSAPGSARITSPRLAKLAVTPPVVGFVKTERKKPPFSSNRARAALVFAICIKERIPSCILAPPLAEKRIRGSLLFAANSMARVIFSPTAALMLPRKNRPSKTPITHFCPSTDPTAVTTASFSPVFLRVASSFAE